MKMKTVLDLCALLITVNLCWYPHKGKGKIINGHSSVVLGRRAMETAYFFRPELQEHSEVDTRSLFGEENHSLLFSLHSMCSQKLSFEDPMVEDLMKSS